MGRMGGFKFGVGVGVKADGVRCIRVWRVRGGAFRVEIKMLRDRVFRYVQSTVVEHFRNYFPPVVHVDHVHTIFGWWHNASKFVVHCP